MSQHIDNYPMLKAHPEWIQAISKMEQQLTGKKFHYIPKAQIANTSLYRKTIKDGDIIAIITSKKGLDTSHIGIAVWHKDGLHMLNASQIRHKVVEEPMPLRTYMSKHPMQIGIRIVRIGKNK
jgi:putative xylanase